MDAQLAAFGAKIEKITSDSALKRVAEAGGMAAKKASLAAASKDLGGDRRMSGMRSKASLGVGFDYASGTTVEVNFRPAGLWKLADEGRRSQGTILPRKRGGKQAVLTPMGPRALSHYSQSRGLGTFKDAVKASEKVVPRAAFKQFQAEIRKAL
jgi:hypothetical protein